MGDGNLIGARGDGIFAVSEAGFTVNCDCRVEWYDIKPNSRYLSSLPD